MRRRSIELGLSYGSCKNAAKELKLFPYRMRVVHESDPIKRTQFCNWFLNFALKDGILDLTFFTDEAWFHLSGYINSRNYGQQLILICLLNPHYILKKLVFGVLYQEEKLLD
jgi:hypothetical protein